MSEKYVNGLERRQELVLPDTLDEYVDEENEVRFIDAFVDALDVNELGFKHSTLEDGAGRPSYDPRALLKLYLWGYLNGVRSSRKLEKECRRNLEVMFLMNKLAPDDKTISDFRKENIECIKPVFRMFVCFLKDLDLVDGKIASLDGVKIKAWNSKKRNFSEEKLEERLKEVDERVKRYFDEIDENDRASATEEEDRALIRKRNAYLKEKLEKLKKKREKLEEIQGKLKKSGQSEISLTDPDSRLMKNNQKKEVCYNAEASVDSKNKFLVEYDVTNEQNDENQLAPMGKKTKEMLGVDEISVTTDKGFFNSKQIKECIDNGIIPYVPEPVWKPAGSVGVPTPDFYEDKFVYDKEKDVYICPAGNEMKFGWMTEKRGYRIRLYMTDACVACPFRSRCTKSKYHGRQISRWEHEEILEEMRRRMKYEQPAMSDLRRELAEHPFGTIKRTFNQGYFLLKSLRKVKGEFGFSVLAYDIRRALNMLGTKGLIDALGCLTTTTMSA